MTRNLIVSRLRRPAAPMLLLSGMFVAAGGVVHLREWLGTYRHVPAALPGAAVVRIGFVVNATGSVVLVVALIVAVFASRRIATAVVGAAALVEAVSLATLIQSRRGSVLGWMEAGWSRGATQTRAVEVGALIALSAAAALIGITRDGSAAPSGGTGQLASVVSPAS